MTAASVTLSELLERVKHEKLPPVHQWDPQSCGEMDMRIARDGTWYYMGSPIERAALVRLFSTVLRRDSDDEHYLVTPSEKLRIRVDDAPFVAVELGVSGTGRNQQLIMRTNIDDAVMIDQSHPIWVRYPNEGDQPAPYVLVRDRLEALVSRSVYYELVELGAERQLDGETKYGVWSAGQFFVLGKLDPVSDM
ncbi:MAG: DUF1285 domain-containing protein [Gammaproteobacteria bacterium]|nr:DUF1285 domain-containing protein [Gammaproteobacteria bacterium]